MDGHTADQQARRVRSVGLAASPPRFVGRGRELTALVATLAHPPTVIHVEGEAGVGKSRVIHELLGLRSAEGHRALVAVCPPLRESLTLGPVADAVSQARDGVVGLGLSGLAGALRPVFPEWAGDLPPAPERLDDARASRNRLFRALAELIDSLGIDLLVVENAQSADESTLEFLLFLASRLHAGRMSLVLTYRPEDVTGRSLLLRLSSRLPAGVTQLRVPLAPLDTHDTAALVSSVLDGKPVSVEFAQFLHERTGGIPLVVEESVRLLCDRADLVYRDGQWVRLSLNDLQVPPSVRDSTRERFGRLQPAAKRILKAAAVLAEAAVDSALAAIGGLSVPAGRAGVAEALGCGLLEEDARGRVGFRHVLAAGAVYEAIPPAERRRLHLRAGKTLERVARPPVAQLARHFREARDTDRWSRYAEQAAERAVASSDYTTATILLHDLLTAAALPAPVRARIAQRLGTVALSRRDAVDDRHRRVIDALRDVAAGGGLGEAEVAAIHNRLGRLLIQLGDFDAARVELERAVRQLDDDPVEAARLLIYLGLPFMSPWPASAHRGWLRRAAEVDLSAQSSADRLGVTSDRAAALLYLGDEEGWEIAGGLPVDLPSRRERQQIARHNANLAAAAIMWGRYADARTWLDAALAMIESDHYLRLRPTVLVMQLHLDWFTGEWDGLADRMAGWLEADERGSRPSVLRLAGRLQAARGAPGRAEEYFRRALDEAERVGLVDETLEPAAALGRLRLQESDVGGALRVTQKPIETVVTKGIWIWATEIAPVRVQALVAAGRTDQAGRLVAKFVRGLRGRAAPGPRAGLALSRATLAEGVGDHTSAATAFARAATAWGRLPRPYDALLSRERQATFLLEGDHQCERGLALLAQTYERFYHLGARADADRVAQLLRVHGGEVPRLWRGGRRGYGDRLSPRELEVVGLVIAGKTNREIARILWKSPATVGRQLQSAMRKLGVSSRTAVATTAMEAGVFTEGR